MTTRIRPALLALSLVAASSQAAGPLIVSNETGTLKPIVWDTSNYPIDTPMGNSGDGDTIMGGLAGVQFSWLIDLEQVFVCKNNVFTVTTFPDGLRNEIAGGALFGRCEFID
ncbi:MAG: hypothetical protein KDI69_09625 [Xanthomonadales bacterium]|nr:hypothetical protein [Xanthomonadales bacterium]